MNLQKMMKQAQEMQSKITEKQQELESREFEGKAGGGMVAVTLNGKGLMLKLSIDDSLLDKEEKEVMEDLIVAAHNDAKQKMEAETADAMSELTGGLQLPPGMKLPF